MAKPSVPEELITIAEVFEQDERLRAWFRGLGNLPENLWRAEISRLVARMESGGEDPQLVAAVRMLCEPEVFHAMSRIVADMH